jgi:sugar phosphate isomerase/epimerase
MKVGIILGTLGTGSLRSDLKKGKALGAHGVQPYVVDNDLDPKTLTKSGRDEFLTFMAGLGLELSALCGELGGFSEPATVDERITRTKTFFDLCVDLHTPILTTHIGVVPPDPESNAYADLVSAVREVATYAAERGCCFATETGPESGKGLAAFLNAVNSQGARINYDPANLCMNGFDHLEDVRVLKDFIVHTHAKDGIARSAVEGEYREVALGDGDVDFPEYLSALRAIGYTGYLTIERECGDDPAADIARAINFLKTQEGVDS